MIDLRLLFLAMQSVYHDAVLSGWKTVYISPAEEQHGLRIACYLNESKTDALIAFRGTVPSDPYNLRDDLILALRQVPFAFRRACEVDQEIRTHFLPKGCRVTYLGHSLGAIQASLMACLHRARAVTYDNPGIGALLDSDERLRSGATDAKIVNFLSAPNVINCLHPQVGRCFRVYIGFHTGMSAGHVIKCAAGVLTNVLKSEVIDTVSPKLAVAAVAAKDFVASVARPTGLSGKLLSIADYAAWLLRQHSMDNGVSELDNPAHQFMRLGRVESWPDFDLGLISVVNLDALRHSDEDTPTEDLHAFSAEGEIRILDERLKKFPKYRVTLLEGEDAQGVQNEILKFVFPETVPVVEALAVEIDATPALVTALQAYVDRSVESEALLLDKPKGKVMAVGSAGGRKDTSSDDESPVEDSRAYSGGGGGAAAAVAAAAAPRSDKRTVVLAKKSLEGASSRDFFERSLRKPFRSEDLIELPGRVVGVRGDGNCFFYAVEHELRRQGLETLTHVELRARAIAYLEAHPDLLNDPIELNDRAEPRIVTRAEYIAEMRKDKTYVEGPIIDALAQALNVHLSVFDLQINRVGVVVGIYPLHINDHGERQRETIGLIRKGQHYQALELKDEHTIVNYRELFLEESRITDRVACLPFASAVAEDMILGRPLIDRAITAGLVHDVSLDTKGKNILKSPVFFCDNDTDFVITESIKSNSKVSLGGVAVAEHNDSEMSLLGSLDIAVAKMFSVKAGGGGDSGKSAHTASKSQKYNFEAGCVRELAVEFVGAKPENFRWEGFSRLGGRYIKKVTFSVKYTMRFDLEATLEGVNSVSHVKGSAELGVSPYLKTLLNINLKNEGASSSEKASTAKISNIMITCSTEGFAANRVFHIADFEELQLAFSSMEQQAIEAMRNPFHSRQELSEYLDEAFPIEIRDQKRKWCKLRDIIEDVRISPCSKSLSASEQPKFDALAQQIKDRISGSEGLHTYEICKERLKDFLDKFLIAKRIVEVGAAHKKRMIIEGQYVVVKIDAVRVSSPFLAFTSDPHAASLIWIQQEGGGVFSEDKGIQLCCYDPAGSGAVFFLQPGVEGEAINLILATRDPRPGLMWKLLRNTSGNIDLKWTEEGSEYYLRKKNELPCCRIRGDGSYPISFEQDEELSVYLKAKILELDDAASVVVVEDKAKTNKRAAVLTALTDDVSIPEEVLSYRNNDFTKLLVQYFKEIKSANGKEVVIAIGNARAGKSTLISYLMGYEFSVVTRVSGSEVKILPKAGLPEAPVIGKARAKVAQTMYPAIYRGADEVLYCDCAGFEGTRKDEKLLALLSVRLIVRMAKIKGVFVVIENESLSSGVGEPFKLLLRTLSAIFANPVSEDFQKAVSFVVTKQPELTIDDYKKYIDGFMSSIDAKLEEIHPDLARLKDLSRDEQKKIKCDLSRDEEKLNAYEEFALQHALLTVMAKETMKPVFVDLEKEKTRSELYERAKRFKGLKDKDFVFGLQDGDFLNAKEKFDKSLQELSYAISSMREQYRLLEDQTSLKCKKEAELLAVETFLASPDAEKPKLLVQEIEAVEKNAEEEDTTLKRLRHEIAQLNKERTALDSGCPVFYRMQKIDEKRTNLWWVLTVIGIVPVLFGWTDEELRYEDIPFVRVDKGPIEGDDIRGQWKDETISEDRKKYSVRYVSAYGADANAKITIFVESRNHPTNKIRIEEIDQELKTKRDEEKKSSIKLDEYQRVVHEKKHEDARSKEKMDKSKKDKETLGIELILIAREIKRLENKVKAYLRALSENKEMFETAESLIDILDLGEEAIPRNYLENLAFMKAHFWLDAGILRGASESKEDMPARAAVSTKKSLASASSKDLSGRGSRKPLSAPIEEGLRDPLEVDVPGDGNCLYYAVALRALLSTLTDDSVFQTMARRLFGDGLDSEQISIVKNAIEKFDGTWESIPLAEIKALVHLFRQRVVAHIETHRAVYFHDYRIARLAEGMLEASIEDEFTRYLARQKVDKTWGGEQEIRAMQDLLGMGVNVLVRNEEGVLEARNVRADGFERSMELVLVDENHYHFLIRRVATLVARGASESKESVPVRAALTVAPAAMGGAGVRASAPTAEHRPT